MSEIDSKALEVKALDVKSREGGKSGVGSAPRQYVGFDKEKALELLSEFPNNITVICKMLGVVRQTWNWNVKHDQEFALRVQEIRDACCDALETTMYNLGVKETSFNFNDRIAFLRAHRPELYNPVKRVIVQGYNMGEGDKQRRWGAVEQAVDAEVTRTYLDKRERREQKQLQAQQQSEESLGGDKAGGAGGTDGKP